MTENSVKEKCNTAFNELLDWRLSANRKMKENSDRSVHMYLTGRVTTIDHLMSDFAEIFGDLWPVDRCHYCGGHMDGDTCHNEACSINEVTHGLC